jgi:K+-transporting ATPase KdpF subunit
LRKGALNLVPHHSSIPAMENILIALIALALLVYLVVAVLRPEKF